MGTSFGRLLLFGFVFIVLPIFLLQGCGRGGVGEIEDGLTKAGDQSAVNSQDIADTTESTQISTLEKTPVATVGVTDMVPPSEFDLVYREFGARRDMIWQIDLNDISKRVQIASVDHATECASLPVISPDGNSVAYTALTRGNCLPTDLAEAFVEQIGGSPRLLANEIILTASPVWSLDSAYIYLVQAGGDGVFSVVRVGLPDGEVEVLLTINALSLTPIGFDDGGAILTYVQVEQDGSTSVGYYDTVDGGLPTVVQVSNTIGRDFALSQNGDSLAFVSDGQAFVIGRTDQVARALDSAPQLPPNLFVGTTQLQPAWHPDGSISVGQLPAGDDPSSIIRIKLDGTYSSVLDAPEIGFDVPISWSPDGSFLLVRSFSKPSATGHLLPVMELVAENGQRLLISENQEASFVGWR